jgi:tetratricopeptide (TPR) repeat protein
MSHRSAHSEALSQTAVDQAEPVVPLKPLVGAYANEEETLELLNKRVSLNNDNLPLRSIVDFLRQATGANIVVNWSALALVEIDRDSLVAINLTDVPASQLLQVALEQVSAEAYDDDKASFAVRGDIVVISSLRALKSTTVLRQYSIDDLANTRPTTNKRIYGRNNDARRMLGMTTLQNKTVDPETVKVKNLNAGFCANCDASHDRLEVALSVMTYYEKVDQITELITTTVGDRDEWLDEESTLTEINRTMLIKTTPENHAQIRKLFKAMRIEQAERFKRQALEMETFVLLEAAEAYRLKQDYDAALKKINAALRVDPNSVEAQALKEIVNGTLSR